MKQTAKVKSFAPTARMPVRAYEGDAGFDLTYARDVPMLVAPLAAQDVPCDIGVEWPDGLWGFMVGRSSTFRNKGIMVNPGIIDAGYRGELFAVCRNITDRQVIIRPGERVAQLIPMPLLSRDIVMTWGELSESDRGTNGFGSTG